MVLSLSGPPDYTLLCWGWMKGKLIASILVSQNIPITRCSFNPVSAKDPLACVTGKDSVKFLRISDRSIRMLREHTMEGHFFTAHYWAKENYDYDTVIAATEAGDLIVYHTGEYICRLACSPGPSTSITYLLPLQSGFIFASKNGDLNVVRFVAADYIVTEHSKLKNKEIDEEKVKIDPEIYSSQYSMVNRIKSDLSNGSVIAMSASPNQNFICAVMSDGQILTFPGNNLSSLAAPQIRYLTSSFHEPKNILGLDMCMRKPIIVTCCADNTFRIWNFVKNTLDMQRSFPEEMLAVALHPTGLHCVIGFTDRLRIYHILVDDLKMCLELAIKNCREVRFNHGGNLIAAVNGNSIFIYDFLSGEKIADLKGHTNKVRSLFWLSSGNELLSSGQDGAIYLWDIQNQKRTGEFLKKGVFYTSVVHSGVNGSVFAVGSDRLLKELSASDLSWVKDIDGGGHMLNQIAFSTSKKALLVSTCEPLKPGTIRVYNYPLVSGDYAEYTCMSTCISRLALSPDENFAVVADEAGCVCVFEIHDKPTNKNQVNKRNKTNDNDSAIDLISVEAWSDEILIPRIDLEERAHIISDLKMKLREQKFQNDFKLKLKETEYSEHTKEITEKFVQDLESARIRLDQIRELKAKSELRCIEQLKDQGDKHQHDIQACETKFQSELMDKVDAYHQLMRRKDAQRERLDEQRKKLKYAHEKYLEELEKDYRNKLEEARLSRAMAESERENLLQNLMEMQNQLEDDIDTEIERMCRNYNDQLLTLRERMMKDKGQLGINKKKCLVVQKEMEELREVTAQLLDRERELHEQIIQLEKEISIHKKEIKSRDISIGEKERRVYELKKKNQELDKFKFVLDFKIRELKQQIEPRQKEIMEMKGKIKDMDKSLEEYHTSNAELDEKIGILRKKIDQLQSHIKQTRIFGKKQENSINNFCIDVNHAVNYVLLPDKLLHAVERILKAHHSMNGAPQRVEQEVEQEYDRHKDFLRSSVDDIKKALAKEVSARMTTNNKLMQDNMGIISEINKQRSSNRVLKIAIQAEIGRIRHYAGKKKNMKYKRSLTFDAGSSFEQEVSSDPQLLLERNRHRIELLRKALADQEASLVQKSYSREILPPMDGVVIADDEVA